MNPRPLPHIAPSDQPFPPHRQLLLTRVALQDKERKIKGLMAEVSVAEAAHSQLQRAHQEISRLRSSPATRARPQLHVQPQPPRAASS